MARIPIEMPKLGYDMETGKVGSWLKKVGDSIARGEVIDMCDGIKLFGH